MLWICVPGQGLQTDCGPAAVFKQMGPLGRVGAASQTPCRGCIPYSFLDRQDLPLRGPAPLTVWPCSPAASPNVCFRGRTRPPCARLQKYGCEVVAAGGPALLRSRCTSLRDCRRSPQNCAANIDAWSRSREYDAIVTNASGCGSAQGRSANCWLRRSRRQRRPRPTLCEAHRRKSPNSWRARAEAACGSIECHRHLPGLLPPGARAVISAARRSVKRARGAIPGLKFREMPNADSLLRLARGIYNVVHNDFAMSILREDGRHHGTGGGISRHRQATGCLLQSPRGARLVRQGQRVVHSGGMGWTKLNRSSPQPSIANWRDTAPG